MEDNLIIENEVKEYQERSYQDLSSEFQRLYPRVIHLIPLMYNRLTLVDKLSHKEAVAKIYNDHQHLSGFSRRNIRRNLPLDNVTVPRRIRPSWPKNSTTKTADASKLSHTIHGQQQDTQNRDDSKETISFVESDKASRETVQEQNQDALTNSKEMTTRRLEEGSAKNEITSYIGNPDPSDKHSSVLCAENAELKEDLSRQTTFVKADEVSVYEIEFTIPKEKYPTLEVAMQQSTDSVYVVFDKSGILERAIPDIHRGKIGHD
ncbi:MAG: hypothetical protein WAM14_12835 [Candidatus Nitrosopolaris sp.]